MPPIQIRQKRIAVLRAALVPHRVLAPGAHGAGEPARHARFARDRRDGLEVGADREDDAAGAGQPAEALPLGAEHVRCDVGRGEGVVPPGALCGCVVVVGGGGGEVFGSERLAPG